MKPIELPPSMRITKITVNGKTAWASESGILVNRGENVAVSLGDTSKPPGPSPLRLFALILVLCLSLGVWFSSQTWASCPACYELSGIAWMAAAWLAFWLAILVALGVGLVARRGPLP